MCPDPQLLSIYLDGELPSPWKEKLESHLNECTACKEKLESFKQIINKTSFAQSAAEENEMMNAAKDRIWQNLQTRRRFQPRSNNIRRFNTSGLMQKRLSIPIPVAAAAAVVIIFMLVLWPSGGQNNNGIALQQIVPEGILEDNDMQVLPVANIDSVLQYLSSSDGSDIIILRLPENKDFHRAGEPAIIRSADYVKDNSEHQSGRRSGDRSGERSSEGSRPTRRNQ
ncbi:MAG: zf-HC2 domain-containing protein [Treponema sp.]|nr:zf-HC2 domain-containing protein [Treponema sp.]